MRIAMLDESGVYSESDFFSMAGYIGHHAEWKLFDADWNAALAKHRIDHLHMWQFAGFRGPFKGWTEQRRRELMADLLAALMQRRLHAYGVCLRVADFKRVPTVADKFFSSYMVCFYELSFGMGLAASSRSPLMGVDCLYSQQDEFKGELKRWWGWAKANKDYASGLGQLDFADMRRVPGLQAADLLAWELRHHYVNRDRRPHLVTRFPFAMMLEHQDWMHVHRIKYLPAWYLASQASGNHNAIMRALRGDSPACREMVQDLTPVPSLLRRDEGLIRLMDKYPPRSGVQGGPWDEIKFG